MVQPLGHSAHDAVWPVRLVGRHVVQHLLVVPVAVEHAFSGGRFAYAFWWSFPLAVVGGYLAVYTSSNCKYKANAKRPNRPPQRNAKTPEEEAIEQAEYLAARRADFTGLEIGTSTGELLERRGHKGGLPSGTPVVLSPEDCSKNIISFGGIGSGKTSRFINPLLLQLMEQNAGAPDLRHQDRFSARSGRHHVPRWP